MKQHLKLIALLMLSTGLMACSTLNQTSTQPEQKPKVEEPKQHNTEAQKPVEKPSKEPVVVKAKKTSDGKLILGEKEWVYVPSLNESFKARIDTGAATSSISAVDVVAFERDGNDWVKFRIEHDDIKSDEISLPVERWVRIRQSSAEGTQRRAVVVAWIEIGDLKERTEFTLADRTHLTYPLLLGRSFFKDVALVDVSRKYIQNKRK